MLYFECKLIRNLLNCKRIFFCIFLGNRGHMAFVQRINDDGPGDPKYETIGLVTLEDVLEELLQQEIYDENDGKINKKYRKQIN